MREKHENKIRGRDGRAEKRFVKTTIALILLLAAQIVFSQSTPQIGSDSETYFKNQPVYVFVTAGANTKFKVVTSSEDGSHWEKASGKTSSRGNGYVSFNGFNLGGEYTLMLYVEGKVVADNTFTIVSQDVCVNCAPASTTSITVTTTASPTSVTPTTAPQTTATPTTTPPTSLTATSIMATTITTTSTSYTVDYGSIKITAVDSQGLARSTTDFGLSESPSFTVSLANIEASQSQKDSAKAIASTPSSDLSVRVLDKNGKLVEVETEITQQTNGAYTVSIPAKRALKPGLYTLSVKTDVDGMQHVATSDFTWGLVSLNSQKSIIKPGENAELVIVVLDEQGRSICDTEILLNVTSPGGKTTLFSRQDGSIQQDSECGLFTASYPTSDLGQHNITISAKVGETQTGIRFVENNEKDEFDQEETEGDYANGSFEPVLEPLYVSFNTNFRVQESFDFDIIRTAESKIDPTKKTTFDVEVNIKTEDDSGSLTIVEYVPSVFEVTTDADVTTEGDVKILKWTKSAQNNQVSIAYSYSVPHTWPYLYSLGPLEISHANGVFEEARSWYVAVDPGSAGRALVGYYTSTNGEYPKYRVWDTTSWNAEANAESVTETTSEWVVVKSSPTRNEKIMGTLDDQGHVNVQVYDGDSRTWGDLVEVTTGIGTTNDAYRGFDIAYETSSGDALIVYSDGDAVTSYRVWNSTHWSGENSLQTDLCTNTVAWVALASHPTSDEIITVDLDASQDICAQVWDGSAWGSTERPTNDANGYTTERFSIAYEQQSGEALVVFQSSVAGRLMYDVWDGGSWGGATYSGFDPGGNLIWLRAAADPASDRIMVGMFEGNDLDAREWNGTAWGTGVALDGNTEDDLGPYRNFDLAFVGSTGQVILAYADNAEDYPNYRTCTSASNCYAGTWAASTPTTTQTCGEASDIKWVGMDKNPFGDELMISWVTQTSGNKCTQQYSGSSWETPSSNLGAGSVLNTAEPIMLAFDQFNATLPGFSLDDSVYYDGETVIINGTDWSSVVNVTINISYPNGTSVSGYPKNVTSTVDGNISDSWQIQSPFGTYNVNVFEADNPTRSDESSFSVWKKATAVIAYTESTDQTPKYRLYDILGDEQWNNVSDALAVGSGNRIRWSVLRAAPTRDEYVLGTLDDEGHVNVQVYDAGSDTWGNLLEITTAIGANDLYRGFDIAYESVSGDAIVVSANGTADPIYHIWDGSSWSTVASIDFTVTTGIPRWIKLASKPDTDELALMILDENTDVAAMIYNSTDFTNEQLLEDSASIITEECIAVAYESFGDEAVFAWGSANTMESRVWNGSSWESELSPIAVIGAAGFVNWLSMKADPSSNRIALLSVDSGSDLNILIWGGTGWDQTTQLDAGLETNAARSADADWERSSGKLVVGYGDSGVDALAYYTWTPKGGWSGYDNGTFGTTDPRVVQLRRVRNQNKVFASVVDDGLDLNVQIYNTTGWENNIEMYDAVSYNTQEPFMLATQSTPTAKTDKERYYTTEVVNITGRYYTPSHNVVINLTNSSGENVSGYPKTIESNADGTINLTHSLSSSDSYGKYILYTYEEGNETKGDEIAFEVWKRPKGILAYSELLAQSPRYRFWDVYDNDTWSDEYYARDVGGGVSNILWVVSRAAPTREEFVVGTLGFDGRLNVQVYDVDNDSWTDPLELTDVIGVNNNSRGFDIAYEMSSGDAIVVYQNNSVDPLYRVWNGTDWSSPQTIDLPSNGIPLWINLESHPTGDEIVLGAIDAGSYATAAVWDGDSWGNTDTLETATERTDRECLDVAYESKSAHAMIAWSDGAVTTGGPQYKMWDGSSWSGESTAPATGNEPDWIRLASDPSSDKIVMGALDSGADLNVNVWDGTQWGTNDEVDAAVEQVVRRTYDVAWETSGDQAQVAWGDATIHTIDYRNYTSGTWSGDGDGPDVGNDIFFVQYARDYESDSLFITTLTDDYDINTVYWNGSGFGTAFESSTSTASFTQETYMMAFKPVLSPYVQTDATSYYRGDNVSISGGNFNAVVNMTVNVTDSEGNNVSGYPKTVVSDSAGAISDWFVLADGDPSGTYIVHAIENDTPSNNASITFTVDRMPDAMIAYAEGIIQTPRFRLWNNVSWTLEDSALSVGTGNSIFWSVLRAAPSRDEYVLGTLDDEGHVNVQVYDVSARSWGNLLEISTAIGGNDAYRGFDIAYESVSGDAIVVSANGTADPVYHSWNGTNWSTVASIDFTVTTGVPYWVRLASHPSKDEVSLMVLDENSDVAAMIWDGGSWSNEQLLETSASMATEEDIAVSYENYGDDAVFAWGSANTMESRVWNGNSWESELSPITICGGAAFVNWLNLKADPTSNRLALMSIDSESDLNVLLWGGHGWDSTTQLDGGLETNAARSADGAWLETETKLVVGFGDSGVDEADYYTWTPSGGWSTAGSAASGSTDPRLVQLRRKPNTDEIMMAIVDDASDLSIQRYNNSDWINHSEVELSAPSWTTESFMVAYKSPSLVVTKNHTLNTTKHSYYHGQVVGVVGSNWLSSANITINVTDSSGSVLSGFPVTVLSDASGEFSYNFSSTVAYDSYEIHAYETFNKSKFDYSLFNVWKKPEAMLAYSEGSAQSPRYRFWDVYDDDTWSDEYYARDVGGGTNGIRWNRSRRQRGICHVQRQSNEADTPHERPLKLLSNALTHGGSRKLRRPIQPR